MTVGSHDMTMSKRVSCHCISLTALHDLTRPSSERWAEITTTRETF